MIEIDRAKRIEISDKTWNNNVNDIIDYKTIIGQVFDSICNDYSLEILQVSSDLPNRAFEIIDELLRHRPDLTFRLYGMVKNNPFDLKRLTQMKNIHHISIDVLNKTNYRRFINLEQLKDIPTLESLSLSVYGKESLSFLNRMTGISTLYLFVGAGGTNVNIIDLSILKIKTIELGGKATILLNGKAPADMRKLVIFNSNISFDWIKNYNQVEEICIYNSSLDLSVDAVNNETVETLTFVNCSGIENCNLRIFRRLKKINIEDAGIDNNYTYYEAFIRNTNGVNTVIINGEQF